MSTPTVVVRPVGNPLPLGFLALAVSTATLSTVQLGWVAPGAAVALAALVFTAPAQLVVAVMAFMARDPVVGSGMGVLAGTWATIGATTLVSTPGSTSPDLAVALLAAAACLLVVTSAATAKPVAATVIGISALRFAATGIYELLGRGPWQTIAGWTGLALAVVALYGAAAFLLEDVHGRPVLPLERRGPGAAQGEAGVRRAL